MDQDGHLARGALVLALGRARFLEMVRRRYRLSVVRPMPRSTLAHSGPSIVLVDFAGRAHALGTVLDETSLSAALSTLDDAAARLQEEPAAGPR